MFHSLSVAVAAIRPTGESHHKTAAEARSHTPPEGDAEASIDVTTIPRFRPAPTRGNDGTRFLLFTGKKQVGHERPNDPSP
jgi:hypothetical protein